MDSSRADEILGSLGVGGDRGFRGGAPARQTAYLAMLRSIVLHERSRGSIPSDLERRWKTRAGLLEGVEEQWRDTTLWLLAGVARLLDEGCFHYHLITECAADRGRIARVRDLLKEARRQTYTFMGDLQRCSPFAPLLGLGRDSGKCASVGVTTIRKLEQSGIDSLLKLSRMGVGELVQFGVTKRAAREIVAYARQRVIA